CGATIELAAAVLVDVGFVKAVVVVELEVLLGVVLSVDRKVEAIVGTVVVDVSFSFEELLVAGIIVVITVVDFSVEVETLVDVTPLVDVDSVEEDVVVELELL